MKVVKSIFLVAVLIILAPIAFMIYPFLEEKNDGNSE